MAEPKDCQLRLSVANQLTRLTGFGVPYSGIYAGLQYALGVPAFISFPHFYKGDENARTQVSHTA